jgi:hypothetical protein
LGRDVGSIPTGPSKDFMKRKKLTKKQLKENHSLSQKRWYKKNKKKILKTERKWRNKNRKKLRKYQNEWRRRNIKERRKKEKSYFKKNKKYIIKRTRKWFRKTYKKRYKLIRASNKRYERKHRGKVARKHKKYYNGHKKRLLKLSKMNYKRNAAYYQKKARNLVNRFSNAKSRSKTSGHCWRISKKLYLKLLQNPCFYCGVSLSSETGSGLDRIDNKKGYLSDNVLPCCWWCNRVRSNVFSVKEMKLLGKVISKIRNSRES